MKVWLSMYYARCLKCHASYLAGNIIKLKLRQRVVISFLGGNTCVPALISSEKAILFVVLGEFSVS